MSAMGTPVVSVAAFMGAASWLLMHSGVLEQLVQERVPVSLASENSATINVETFLAGEDGAQKLQAEISSLQSRITNFQTLESSLRVEIDEQNRLIDDLKADEGGCSAKKVAEGRAVETATSTKSAAASGSFQDMFDFTMAAWMFLQDVVLDAVGGVWSGPTVQGIRDAVSESVELGGKLLGPVADLGIKVPYKELQAVRSTIAEVLAGPLASARIKLGPLITTLLDRYPEHKAVLSDRDPLLVAFILLLLVATLALTILWQLLGCLGIVSSTLGTVIGAIFCMMCLPFCICCRKRRTPSPTELNENRDANGSAVAASGPPSPVIRKKAAAKSPPKAAASGPPSAVSPEKAAAKSPPKAAANKPQT